MHVQIVNFQLNGIDEDAYAAACEELAPTFAEMPGLLSKVWLADAETNTYGGVYLWADRESFEAYTRGEIFAGIGSNPGFTGVTSRDFDVLEAPTAVTSALAGAGA